MSNYCPSNSLSTEKNFRVTVLLNFAVEISLSFHERNGVLYNNLITRLYTRYKLVQFTSSIIAVLIITTTKNLNIWNPYKIFKLLQSYKKQIPKPNISILNHRLFRKNIKRNLQKIRKLIEIQNVTKEYCINTLCNENPVLQIVL